MHLLIIITCVVLYAFATVLAAILLGYVAGIYLGTREVARYRAIQRKVVEDRRSEGIALDERKEQDTNGSRGTK